MDKYPYLDTFSFDKPYAFHSSNRNGLENKAYVALDHGEPFFPRAFTQYLRDTIEVRSEFTNDGFKLLERTISASYLIAFDLPGKAAALDFAEKRLSSVSTQVFSRGHDYYLSAFDKQKFSVPKKYMSSPVINPAYDPWIGTCPLPTIHDLFLLKSICLGTGEPSPNQARIVNHVMSESYQNQIPRGYGYSFFPQTKKVYGCGWSCHLGVKNQDRKIPPSSILPRCLLLSSFPEAIKSPFYKKAKQFISSMYARDEKIPPPFLVESAQGYWVEGAFMSYGVKLRKSTRHEISKARILQLGHSSP